MKKIIAALLMSALVAVIAYAGAPTTAADTGTAADGKWDIAATSGKITYPGDTTNGPLLEVIPSANVGMAYNCTDGTLYTLGTYHSNGTKVFGTNSIDAKLYFQDTGAVFGTNAPSVDIPTVSSPGFGAAWTALK